MSKEVKDLAYRVISEMNSISDINFKREWIWNWKQFEISELKLTTYYEAKKRGLLWEKGFQKMLLNVNESGILWKGIMKQAGTCILVY